MTNTNNVIGARAPKHLKLGLVFELMIWLDMEVSYHESLSDHSKQKVCSSKGVKDQWSHDTHSFEDSVCLGFKTRTNANKEAGKRENKGWGPGDTSPLKWFWRRQHCSGDRSSPGVRKSPWRKQDSLTPSERVNLDSSHIFCLIIGILWQQDQGQIM